MPEEQGAATEIQRMAERREKGGVMAWWEKEARMFIHRGPHGVIPRLEESSSLFNIVGNPSQKSSRKPVFGLAAYLLRPVSPKIPY